jgi:hypothetical protein
MDPNTDDRLEHEDLTVAERAELEQQEETQQSAPAQFQPPAAAAEPRDDDREVLLAATQAATQAAQAATEALRRQQQPVQTEPTPDPTPAQRDFNAEFAALKESYNAGNIDRDEYFEQRLTLEQQRSEALVEQRVAERLQQREQQASQQSWEQTYAGFLGQAENAKLTGPALNAAFNTAIQTLYQQDPAISHSELLAKARDQVFTEIGIPVPSAAETADKIAKAVSGRRAADPPPMDTGRIPQAGALTPSAQDAQLDDLPADQLEDWLARNPSKAEAYLEGAPGGLRDYPRAAA